VLSPNAYLLRKYISMKHPTKYPKDAITSGSGSKGKRKATASFTIRIKPTIPGNSKTMCLKAKEGSTIATMPIIISVSGEIISPMVQAHSSQQLEQDTKENGSRPRSRARASRHTLTPPFSKDASKPAKKEKAPSFIIMGKTIPESWKETKDTAEELCNSETAANIKASGWMMRCTAKECLPGTQDNVIKGHTSKVKSMEKVKWFTLMVLIFKANGNKGGERGMGL